MTRETNSAEGVLAYLPTVILPYITKEPTREDIIKLHIIISGNAASVASNSVGGLNGHPALTTTT